MAPVRAEMVSWAMDKVGGVLEWSDGVGVRAFCCSWGPVPGKEPPLHWHRLGAAAGSSSKGMALGVLVGSKGMWAISKPWQ